MKKLFFLSSMLFVTQLCFCSEQNTKKPRLVLRTVNHERMPSRHSMHVRTPVSSKLGTTHEFQCQVGESGMSFTQEEQLFSQMPALGSLPPSYSVDSLQTLLNNGSKTSSRASSNESLNTKRNGLMGFFALIFRNKK